MTWPLGVMVGLGVGLVHFGGLWWSVRRLSDPSGASRHLRLGVLRFAALAAALATLARSGAGVLAAALFGLWLARGMLILRWGGGNHGT